MTSVMPQTPQDQTGFTGCGNGHNAVILSEAKDLSVQYLQSLTPTRCVLIRRLIVELAFFPQPLSVMPQTPQDQTGFTGCGNDHNAVILSEAKDLSVQYLQPLTPTRCVLIRRLIVELAFFPQPLQPLRSCFSTPKTQRIPRGSSRIPPKAPASRPEIRAHSTRSPP
jgi:hypothetical protein